MAKTIPQLVREARMLHEKLQKVKLLYEKMDTVINDLKDQGFVSLDGVTMVDNFKEKNIKYKATGIRRFELEFEDDA